LLSRIHRGLAALGSDSIKTVTVYGRQRGQRLPAWTETFELSPLVDGTPLDNDWLVSPSPTSPESTTLTTKQVEDLIRTKGKLSLVEQSHIHKLAQFLVDFLVPSELIEDIIGVRYRGNRAALLLTNQRLACFSFLKDIQPRFICNFNEIAKVVASEKGLKIHQRSSEFIVYFENKQLARQFIDRNLTKITTVDRKSRIPNENQGRRLIAIILLLAVFVVVIILYLLR
jgi:hypothetical protein